MPYSTDALTNFNATTCSTSTISPAEPSPDGQSLDAQLLRELESLHQQLVQSEDKRQVRSGEEGPPRLLAVARLVQGMDRRAWEGLRESMDLGGWCALEVCTEVTPSRLCAPHLADCARCANDCDPLTGALLAAPLLQQLHKELIRAERGQSQVAVAIFALLPPQRPHLSAQEWHAAALLLASALQRHALSCDSLGRIDRDKFVLILPGAGLFKAQAVVEEILAHCTAIGGPPCAAGIAGSSTTRNGSILLQNAGQALLEAQRQGMLSRVFRETANPLVERTTLVHSDEKRFLFSGGDD